MALLKGHKANFNTMLKAARNGDLALMQCTDAKTGAARLARILHRSAQDLWDACVLTDSGQMWEEARAIASRILASCPGD